MPLEPSPQKASGGPTQNFIPLDSPHSNYRSSRSAIKTELPGKLVFDDDGVFQRLGIHQVSEAFVKACASSFKTKNWAAIQALKEIIANAERKSVEQLEAEATVTDQRGNKRRVKKEEIKMYLHLRSLFEFIETYPNFTRQYHRQFIATNSMVLKAEFHTWGFPEASPDFTLMESAVGSTLWRDRAAFAEIKPSTKQGPKPAKSNNTTILSIVSQCADYARLHLSARPFQLFSVGLLIFGHQFCVGIFDRDGITFSPIYDMWRDTETFIRVVRRLSCDLSPVELGQDPTVTMLSDKSDQYKALQALAKQLFPEASTFPTFSISMGGNDPRRWCTVGPPIWNSLSFLGRGTSIWRVLEIKNDRLSSPVMVMKSAWRSSNRLGESKIYQSIVGSHPGLAKYIFGADVQFPNGDVITVNALRHHNSSRTGENPILHRLFLLTLGRPLWEYVSELELLKGLRAALRAHEFLCKQGVLHRDISAGNILLSATSNADPGHEGFLTDLEFAHISSKHLTTSTTVTIPVSPVRGPSGMFTEPTTRSHAKFETVSVPHGAAMSGTVQFMASEILDGFIYNTPVVHQPRHDIESFIWVMCYSMCRQMLNRNDLSVLAGQQDRDSFFHNAFGRVELHAIVQSKKAGTPLDLDLAFDGFLSRPMASLLRNLADHVTLQYLRNNPVSLTHEMIMGEFDRTIEELEKL